MDFFSCQYGGTDAKINHQKIQGGLKARKARGADLVFDQYKEVRIEGTLPGGGRDSAIVKVAAMVPFFILKAHALKGRLKPKDAYDIYFCLKNYPDGIDALIEEFRPHIKNSLLREALEIILEKFCSIDRVGPVQVADFEGVADADDRDIVQRDAFGQVKNFLEQLDFR